MSRKQCLLLMMIVIAMSALFRFQLLLRFDPDSNILVGVVSKEYIQTKTNATSAATERDEDEAEFDFLSSIHSQAWPMWEIVSAAQGNYNRCGDSQPIMWVLLSGHIRTLHDHLVNLNSFLNFSSPCWFVVVFTRDVLTGELMGHGKKCTGNSNCEEKVRDYNVTEHLNDMMQNSFESNFAYAVCKRRSEPVSGVWHGEQYSPEWPGATMTTQLVAQAHGIRHNSADIAVLSRPDIIVSHAIQTQQLHQLATKRNFTFVVPHHASRFGVGCDPTETWALMSWDLLIGMCSLEISLAPCQNNMTASECLSPICLASFTTASSRCGHYYRRVLSSGTSYMGGLVFYVPPELKIHFHRLTGESSLAVNAPGSRTIGPGKNVEAPLDLTKNVGCEYNPPNVCDLRKTNQSTALIYGVYQAQFVEKGVCSDGAMYVCTERTDLQVDSPPEIPSSLMG